MQIPDSKDPQFAAAMKMLRRRGNKTLKELEDVVGVSSQAMSRWENASALFPPERVPLYLRGVGATEADLEREMGEISEVGNDFNFGGSRAWWAAYPKDLQGVHASDESMSPWCEPGETLWVERDRHPRRNEGCLVEFADGSTAIRLYIRERDGFYFFQRINPESVEQVLHSKVAALHRVALRGS